jgi:uncharacterized secreted repeat protein (TIGR03808 family)
MSITRRSLFAATAALAALAPARSFAQIEAALGHGFVNAADFGMISNNLAEGDDPAAYDQSAKLQEAVRAAAGAGFPLFIPPGYYAVNLVDIPTATTIFGVRGRTVLMSNADAPMLTCVDGSSVTLRDLSFDATVGGGHVENPGVLVFGVCENLRLDGLSIQGGSFNAISLERCSGRIENLVMHSARESGIFAYNNAGLQLIGNRISSCGNAGIRVWGEEGNSTYDGTIVANNDIYDIRADSGGNGQYGNGINVYLANGVTISDNHLRRCAFSAIRVNAGNDTVISGNTCVESGEVAIFSEFGFSGSVIADNIVDSAAQGISMTNFDSGGRLATCTGNIVRNIAPTSKVNPDTTPAGIFAEADAVIANNVVENVPGVGIGAGWGPFLRDVSVSGNVIRDVDIGIAVSVAEGAGRAMVSSNLISGARRAGIAGMAWDQLVSTDLQVEQDKFPNVAVSDNRSS